jgi:hypothetical protein
VSTANAIELGCYVYGIIDPQDGINSAMHGIDGGEIELIKVGEIAAVVTRVPCRKIRPIRTNLAAHNNLLHELVQHQPIIPSAFGMIASSDEQLRKVLQLNHDKLQNLLNRFRGKVEMSLSVYWNTSNIFDFFVTTNQELKKMRDQMFRPGRDPSMEERLELGRMFETSLQQCRERHTKLVIDTLSPYCEEICSIDPGAVPMIMKLVSLIKTDHRTRFEDGIQEAARKFDDHYCFKYSGPWAPFDFVDVTLDIS